MKGYIMDGYVSKDIFISYKNDGEGSNFAARLYANLDDAGFDVYFNPHEQHSGNFPDQLRMAVKGCKDFILILSKGCLAQLQSHEKIDWIREELLTAKTEDKNIVPILVSGVSMPKDKEDMPEDLCFLPDLNAITLPEQYTSSPFDKLISLFRSKAEKGDIYRNTYNSNSSYDVNKDYKKTLESAEQGNIQAMYEIANMCLYGISDENGTSAVNNEKAFLYLKKLSETENEYQNFALQMIGHMYYQGIVPREEQSYKKCYEIHSRLIDSVPEIHHIAYMQSIGSGCDFDFEKAESMYRIAIKKGNATAIFALAEMYNTYGKFKDAEKLYLQIYDKMPQAAIALGKMYKIGVLNEPPYPDYFRAAFYYEYAIQSNKCGSEPYCDLGKMYFNPTGGFPKDFEKAQNNFVVAAEMENGEAQYMLGYMYVNGHVEYSLEKAAYYFEKAVENGNMMSAVHLATIYQNPQIQNYHKAFYYARLAAKSGISSGAFVYANLLFIGRGCISDINEAYKYYRIAFEHGFEQAQFMLKKCESLVK